MDRMNTASKKYSKIRTLLDESIEKLKDPKLIDNAKEWLNNHYKRVNMLFADKSLVDFVFAPFKKVFTPPANTDTAIYSIITTVAVVNAVLAALPGKMGVGVLVSWGLEGWMAFNIARHVGFKLNKISDVWQYFGVAATVIVTIVWGFKALLGLTFSLFSFSYSCATNFYH